MSISRRQFLRHGALLSAGLCLPASALASLAEPERSLSLYNTHTGESLNRVFWAEGAFISESLAEINKLLRDHRTNDVAAFFAVFRRVSRSSHIVFTMLYLSTAGSTVKVLDSADLPNRHSTSGSAARQKRPWLRCTLSRLVAE